jgi:hypothetical protein
MEKEPDGVKDVIHMKVLSNNMSHIISHIVTYIANEITQEELRSLREQGVVIFDPVKLYINIIGKDKIGNTWKDTELHHIQLLDSENSADQDILFLED